MYRIKNLHPASGYLQLSINASYFIIPSVCITAHTAYPFISHARGVFMRNFTSWTGVIFHLSHISLFYMRKKKVGLLLGIVTLCFLPTKFKEIVLKSIFFFDRRGIPYRGPPFKAPFQLFH